MSSRAIVIGSGANELVAAHRLARGGFQVIVSGEGSDSGHGDIGWAPPQVIRAFALERNGLVIDRPDPWAAAPLAAGGRLELWCDMARSVESIRRLSPRDAAKWPEFCARMACLAGFLEAIYQRAPPDPLSLKFALHARLLGRQGLVDLLRLLPMSVAELLDDWFESDALKGLLGAAGVMHLAQGPRSGGTAFRLLHHHVGSPPGVFRPPRSNIRKVLAKLPGIETRAGKARSIAVREGRVVGVVLESGDEIPASMVLSGADPRRTLLELADPGWLDPELSRSVQHVRRRGVVARVTLELDRSPGFSTLAIAPSLDYLERACDDAKYGGVSRLPYLEACCDERHRVEVHVQYVPFGVEDAGLVERVVKALSAHLGGAAVAARAVSMPADLEEREGWPGGQLHHAELTLDQALWMRPVPQLARYRTPIAGLWLCGPAMHPGGGIAGACGWNCAGEILASRP